MLNIEACLPPKLRGPSTTITPISAGMSGAGVYRVEAAGEGFVLKVAGEGEPVADWRRRLRVLRLAAANALAPRIVHVDEERRAVVSAFAAGRPFAMVYGDPRTRDAALAQLAATLRRVHQLPLPPDAAAVDPRQGLAAAWTALGADFVVPDFVGGAVRRMLAEEPPADECAAVLSHNDVNPGNLVYAGEELLLVDWEHAGPNHPFYDLAAICVFLRMDEGAQRSLLAAYDGEPVSILPPRFAYCRRLVAVLCGVTFLQIARTGGHPGAADAETPDSTPSLGEFYRRMRDGSLSLATAEGQWRFGLALVKEALAA